MSCITIYNYNYVTTSYIIYPVCGVITIILILLNILSPDSPHGESLKSLRGGIAVGDHSPPLVIIINPVASVGWCTIIMDL